MSNPLQGWGRWGRVQTSSVKPQLPKTSASAGALTPLSSYLAVASLWPFWVMGSIWRHVAAGPSPGTQHPPPPGLLQTRCCPGPSAHVLPPPRAFLGLPSASANGHSAATG